MDYSPVTVVTPKRKWSRARLVVEGSRAYVFVIQDNRPALVASAELAECSPCGGATNLLRLADGEEWHTSTPAGCGCNRQPLPRFAWRPLTEAAEVPA